MHQPVRRIAIGAVALILPLTAAACGSDSKSDEGAGTTVSPMDTTTMPSGSETTAAPSGMDEPFGSACASVPTSGAGSFKGMAQDPVATAASNNPALSTLVTAVKEAGLVDTLNSTDDITVFAPTNDAFGALDKATLDKALADPKGLLTTVLQNHVVKGRIAPADLAGEHKTIGGGTITVDGSGENFTVGTAKVVCGNVQTANATVYIIDGVLLPQ